VLHLIADASDTWSHGIDRYGDEPAAVAHWDSTEQADRGPLMASLIQKGRIGDSALQAEYRVYKGVAMGELLLRVQWVETHKILKLTLPLPGEALCRFDGIPGGELERPLTGCESPIRDRTLLELADGSWLGVVCPEVYAMDCTPTRLRLTLLRSPFMAHHDPHGPQSFRGRVSDRGENDFRLRIFHGPDISGRQLDEQALAWQRPLITADLTRGMPAV
jgi:alpha-mannosidase